DYHAFEKYDGTEWKDMFGGLMLSFRRFSVLMYPPDQDPAESGPQRAARIARDKKNTRRLKEALERGIVKQYIVFDFETVWHPKTMDMIPYGFSYAVYDSRERLLESNAYIQTPDSVAVLESFMIILKRLAPP